VDTECGLGITPTARQVVQEQIHLIRFANGKGVEHRMMQSLAS
jgi:hypothetical protein